ncbi:DUF6215 domain-containing protein [Streptomyces sp. DG2A-72]|uniref:DUF6215 domain-containing protein n=1 Tax=Streptomyces sp. DG2A-72 TaxID=3051386 RepID=UPI00265C3986|nr:DUF6215 domain-containing protein [Streptomyces sp. DG2A-72]MDO0931674.1 DUF6215 domain-containing protein [Streptomyces sp. DG2A-72]
MADNIGAPTKDPSPVGQAVAAIVLVGALAAGFWTMAKTSAAQDSSPPAPTCSDDKPETPPASGQVSGQQLCEALHRPDLARLLGTPGETATTVSGSDSSVGESDGEQVATPSARVEFATYTVELTATYDDLPVTGSAQLLGRDARDRKVLGRPATFYSSQTIALDFRLDGGDSSSAPGVPARALTVAQDAKDSGGSFDLAMWRADGRVPNDEVLLDVAEKVLPAIPGWTAGK